MVIRILRDDVYTFAADIKQLHYLVDCLVAVYTPMSTQRICNQIRSILERIEQNREASYVDYVVRQYFKEVEEDA